MRYKSIIFIVLICLVIPQKCIPADLLQQKEAKFYQKEENGLRCLLCPRKCLIVESKRGFCAVRQNENGVLYTLSFGRPVSLTENDPIEKKPFFHYLPKSLTFSVATAGCNFTCKFCQNWEISQSKPEDLEYIALSPEDLVNRVISSKRNIIAYTYNEPTIFFEYMLEVAKLAKKKGLINVMHSNGFINEEPLKELVKYMDAANIDLKAFNDDYYSKLCSGSLAPVLKSLKILKEAGVHLEVTNLILPGLNDDTEELSKMCIWIKDNLGADIPVHFSRFFPSYKLEMLSPTPVKSLERARLIALDTGLKYVYIGNVSGFDYENTNCPKCKKELVKRRGYVVLDNLIKDNACPFCGEKIYGKWE